MLLKRYLKTLKNNGGSLWAAVAFQRRVEMLKLITAAAFALTDRNVRRCLVWGAGHHPLLSVRAASLVEQLPTVFSSHPSPR
jgi:hypothetical protein